MSRLPKETLDALERQLSRQKHDSSLVLNCALNYAGGRAECHAVQALLKEVETESDLGCPVGISLTSAFDR